MTENEIMKTKNLFLLPALIASFGLIPAGRVMGQTFTTLHSFAPGTGGYYPTNSDGASPYGELVLSGDTLYGTAEVGGGSGNGTVFRVNTDGTGFTNLHTFSAGSGSFPDVTNSEGAGPYGGLVLSGNTLFGTAIVGGSSGNGTVFRLNIDGTGFTNLHTFAAGSGSIPSLTNSDGANPFAGLILSNNTLYGAAVFGGSSGNGTLFALNTDGTGFTNLHDFAAGSGSFPDLTNSDGAGPFAGLMLSNNTLYGTAEVGGSSGNGSVFKVNADGTDFTNLHNFTPLIYPGGTNSDGDGSRARLILSGNTLYGVSHNGGASGYGTVFALSTDGTGFTNLHNFPALNAPFPYPNSDGAVPNKLILSGHTLYGTAEIGGTSGNGTVFALNTDGSGFTNLHSFTLGTGGDFPTNSDGALPRAGLILSGNALYGTASQGGSSGNGTVFSVSLPAPRLTLVHSDTNVVLMWPTDNGGFDFTGYTLQSASNLVSPTVWTNVSPAPVAVNGQNAVTNPISGPQQFYRLNQ